MNECFKYRFKTEEEFIKEYGENWRWKVGFTTSGSMDFLCGTIYEKSISEETFMNFANGDFWIIDSYCGWNISTNMLKKRILEPNYKSKKFSREI